MYVLCLILLDAFFYDGLVLMNNVPRVPPESFPQTRLLNGASTADPYLALNQIQFSLT